MVIWCRLEIWLVSTIALQDLRSGTAPPTVSHYGVGGIEPRNTTPPSLAPRDFANIRHPKNEYVCRRRTARATHGTTVGSRTREGDLMLSFMPLTVFEAIIRPTIVRLAAWPLDVPQPTLAPHLQE